MEVVLQFRGRAVTRTDAQFIQELIAKNKGESRHRLSKLLCEAWNWRQPNGTLCDMICRSLMLALHRAGHIQLPPAKRKQHNPLASRPRPQEVPVDRTPICTSLKSLAPLTVRQVRRTPDEAAFNWLMESEHYLRYAHPVGENLKFMVFAGAQPVALFAWSSAPRHLGPRDRYLGWSPEVRRKGIRFIAYNTRYLIPSWIQVPHLASHALSRMTRILSQEWEKVYGHPVHFAETFVDRSRHRGTCYRAANWVQLGQTTGRGKDDQTHRPNRTIKDVLGLPLREDFRERLLAA
jgi:Domain of unknown function (DUF4338)